MVKKVHTSGHPEKRHKGSMRGMYFVRDNKDKLVLISEFPNTIWLTRGHTTDKYIKHK